MASPAGKQDDNDEMSAPAGVPSAATMACFVIIGLGCGWAANEAVFTESNIFAAHYLDLGFSAKLGVMSNFGAMLAALLIALV